MAADVSFPAPESKTAVPSAAVLALAAVPAVARESAQAEVNHRRAAPRVVPLDQAVVLLRQAREQAQAIQSSKGQKTRTR